MRRRTIDLAALLALLLATTWAFGPTVHAAVPTPQDEEEEEEGEDGEDGEDEDEDEDEEDEYFAIVGGDVYSGAGAFMRGATILAKNGVIEEIGHGLYLPEGTETLNARGMRVYPGLVALSATSSISEGLFSSQAADEHEHDPHYGIDGKVPDDEARASGSDEDEGVLGHVETEDEYVSADDGDQYGDPDGQVGSLPDEEGVVDSFDPFSQYLVLALATGITTAQQGDTTIKLRRGEIEGVWMNERSLVTIPWSSSNPGTIRSAREKFAKAAEYLRKWRRWDELDAKTKKEKKEPSKKGVDTTALRVLKGDARARFVANDRADLLGIARLAQEHGFRPVVEGCREGWTVAEELGRAGAFAIVTPRDRSDKDERLVRPGGSSIENAAILHRSGVQVAIRPSSTAFDLSGITGRDLLHLTTEAAFGVRGGLPETAALEAITVVPARILGVDHRVGSLEVGKDLDAILTDGDVLHYETFVQYAVVAGKEVYDKDDEIFFAHIRPRPPAPEPAEEPADGEGETEAGEEQGEEDESASQDDDSGESEEGAGDEEGDEDGS